jgi:hypothetical protein
MVDVLGANPSISLAPALFVIAYDTSITGTYPADGGVVEHEWIEADAGTLMQNMLLEASAYNLNGRIVSQGLDQYNGNGANAVRGALGLPGSVIPLYIVPIGFNQAIPEFPATLMQALLIALVFVFVTCMEFMRRTQRN